MKKLRGSITYANVISTLALFLVLAGGTALAATKLAKNSVGAKQIKNDAITGAKIKNGTITGSKIAAGSIGGSAIDRGSLGTVPSAIHASSADQATSALRATTAERAETVPAPEAIHSVSFEPGCSDGNRENVGPAGFYKDAFGEVHLVGGIFCGTEGADAFVLPPGFRPSTEIIEATIGSKAGAELLVLPSGIVRAFGSTTATLFGVSFRTN